MYYNSYNSICGNIILVSDGNNLIKLYFSENKVLNTELEIFTLTKKWLDIYFNGGIPKFNLKIKIKGTSFQIKVWKYLQSIEYGKSTNYKEIANKLNTSPRAIGNAVSKNPIAIIIPCHRVLSKDKKIIGYAYGIDKMKLLLKLEKISYKD